MLHPALILTNRATSNGKRLLTTTPILAGTVIWRLNASEQRLSYSELMQLPYSVRKLAWPHTDAFILTADGREHMQHACDPNIWWESDECLIARRDIGADEEITCDYTTFDIQPGPRPPFWGCCCPAKTCRGIVTVKDCLKPRFIEHYQEHLPSWTVRYIRVHQAQQAK